MSEEAAPLRPFGLFCAELGLCQHIFLAPKPLWGAAEQQEDLLEQPPTSAEQSLPSLKTALRRGVGWHIHDLLLEGARCGGAIWPVLTAGLSLDTCALSVHVSRLIRLAAGDL